MPAFCRLIILFLLLIPRQDCAQNIVKLDFTQSEYNLYLNYTSATIGAITRSYGSPNALNISQEVIFYEAPISGQGSGSEAVNAVSITHEARFAGALFNVPCNFSKFSFDSAGDFRGAHFSSTTDFSEVTFFGTSSFFGAIFDSTSLFSDAFFQRTCNFMGAHFNSKSFFSKADFRFPSYFSGAQFSAESDFTGAHFDSITFSGAEFHSKCDFADVLFNSSCDFSSGHFHATVNFSKVSFGSIANFNGGQFDKDVNFSGAHFNRKAKLQLAKIKVANATSFDFKHAVLPDSIDFSNNTNISTGISTVIDFTLADSLDAKHISNDQGIWYRIQHLVKRYFYPSDTAGTFQKHKINLYNTDVSKIKLDYEHFKFYAYDIENQDSAKSKMLQHMTRAAYEGLLKNFESRGQTDSYEKLDIEYKRYKAGLKPGDFSFQDMWWGFGYQRWRILIHAFLLVFFFSCINFFCLSGLNNKQNGAYPIAAVPEFPYKLWQKPVKRFWYSFIYTATLFFALTLKIDKIKFSQQGIRPFWVIIIYFAGLICMAFMVSWVLHI